MRLKLVEKENAIDTLDDDSVLCVIVSQFVRNNLIYHLSASNIYYHMSDIYSDWKKTKRFWQLYLFGGEV